MQKYRVAPVNYHDRKFLKDIIRLNRIMFLSILAGYFFVPPLAAQIPQSHFERLLEPRIKRVMKQQSIPGLAIAVIDNGQLVYIKGFGVGSLNETYTPVTPQSVFHMASLTKPFVAVAVMQLIEQGLVNPDDPVVRYLPLFKMADERYKAITIRQMLSHTSGIPDEYTYDWEDPQYDAAALERYVRSLAGRSLVAAPGSEYQYSNAAYEVLGDLIAKVSGVSFECYMSDHILKMLGMENSTLMLQETNPATLVAAHVLDGDYNVCVSAVYPYNRAHAPSSTLHSTAFDMSRWARAILNHGQLDGQRILGAAACDTMEQPVDKQWPHAGLGWALGEYRGYRTIGHSGGDVGFAANMLLVPDKKVAVIIMSNYERAAVQPLTTAALDEVLGYEPQEVTGIANLQLDRLLYRRIMQDSIEAALKLYNDLKQQPPGFDFNQVRQLNRLGYNLLGRNKTREAIEIFKLNVQAYPGLAFVWDSLAEAYMKDGDKDLAIKNYKKALQLNPGSRHAATMLKKLQKE